MIIGCHFCLSDYAQAALFLTDLLSALELSPDQLIMCAGNHDLDRTATIGMLPPPSNDEAGQWLRIENLTNLARPFANYGQFCDKFGLERLKAADVPHNLIGQRDLLGLRFVVLNSAIEPFHVAAYIEDLGRCLAFTQRPVPPTLCSISPTWCQPIPSPAVSPRNQFPSVQ